MKVTYGDIYTGVGGLNLLMAAKIQFPIETSWEIVKLMNQLDREVKPLNDLKSQLVTELGKPGLGGQISIAGDDPAFAVFSEKFNTVLTQEIEVDFEKIKLPLVIDGKPIQIEPAILYQLAKFINLGENLEELAPAASIPMPELPVIPEPLPEVEKLYDYYK
tara:strand:- start:751 stop:1236 length:486 start_codon:yes stop_codon:yes gene_type:complete